MVFYIAMTHSEEIFELICRNAGYEIEHLDVRDREANPSADFVIGGGDFRLIAEVEELRPNKDDLRQISA